MADRLDALGGRVDLYSEPGAGTTLKAASRSSRRCPREDMRWAKWLAWAAAALQPCALRRHGLAGISSGEPGAVVWGAAPDVAGRGQLRAVRGLPNRGGSDHFQAADQPLRLVVWGYRCLQRDRELRRRVCRGRPPLASKPPARTLRGVACGLGVGGEYEFSAACGPALPKWPVPDATLALGWRRSGREHDRARPHPDVLAGPHRTVPIPKSPGS